jgi:hypothetical protein
MKQYLEFNSEWESKPSANLLDFNDGRVRVHLKALLRDQGSSTENIVIDFVRNTWDSLVKYPSFRAAWDKLDLDQKDMVVGFRAFTDMAHISATAGDFVADFYCGLVRDRYTKLEVAIEESTPIDDEFNLSLEDELKLAAQADREIKAAVGEHNAVPAFCVKEEDQDV